MSAPIKVILDTNFLMLSEQFKIDIFKEISRLLDVKYDLFVPEKVLLELQTIEKKGSLKDQRAARIGLRLAENLKKLDLKGPDPDEAILEGVDTHTVVCTNDRKLKEEVLKKGGRVIFMRQRKFLELIGGEFGIS